MKVMDDYSGIPGRALYIQGSQIRQFTIWSKKDEREPIRYIYVPRSQVDHDVSLKLVCERAIKVDNGYMVTVPQWESRITPEGARIP